MAQATRRAAPPPRQRTTVRFRKDLLTALDMAALEAGLNRSDYMQQALAKHLTKAGYPVRFKAAT